MNEFCLKEHNLNFYAWMRWRLGENASKIHDDLYSQIGSLAPTALCIHSWIDEFQTSEFYSPQIETNSIVPDSSQNDEMGSLCPVTKKIQTLSPLFCSNGTIRSISLVNDFLKSMDDAHILEERYLFIYILYITEDVQILTEFARCGGWIRLGEWLKYSTEILDYSFIKELLKLFEKLPLTEQEYITDETHQIVESLTKAECNEKVKSNKRMNRYQNENGMSVICHTSPFVLTRNSANSVKSYKGKTRAICSKETTMNSDTSGKREDLIRSKQQQQNSDGMENVLMMKSTSLNNSANSVALTSFKIPKKIRTEAECDESSKVSVLSPSSESPTSGDKKRKIDFEEYLIKKGNLLKDAKRSKKNVRGESFDRALLDAAETNEKPSPKLGVKRKTKADDKGSSCSLSAEKINSFSSIQTFYQDTLASQTTSTEDVESCAVVMEESSDSLSLEIKEEMCPIQTAGTSSVLQTEQDDVESAQDALEVVEIEEKAAKDQRKSNLSEPGIKKTVKKKVCWADNSGSELERIKYFELDESEKLQHRAYRGDIGKLEMTMERNMRLNMGYGPGGTTNVSYGPLIKLELPPSTIIPEVKSREKAIQEERQKGILQDIFFAKSLIPDSPSEPEFESIFEEKKEPILIPLNDVEESQSQVSEAAVSTTSTTPTTTTTTSSAVVPPGLPPKLADLLARAQKQSQNDSEKTESMLQQIKAFLGQATQSADSSTPDLQLKNQRPVCSNAPGNFIRPPLFIPPPIRAIVTPLTALAPPDFLNQPRQPFQPPANPDTPLMQFQSRPQASAFNLRGVLPPRLREPIYAHVNHAPRNPRFPGSHMKFRAANRGNRGGWV